LKVAQPWIQIQQHTVNCNNRTNYSMTYSSATYAFVIVLDD